jgi:hypothetical protein
VGAGRAGAIGTDTVRACGGQGPSAHVTKRYTPIGVVGAAAAANCQPWPASCSNRRTRRCANSFEDVEEPTCPSGSSRRSRPS